MRTTEPGVFVPASMAGALLEVVAPEITRRQNAGLGISDSVRSLLGDLGQAAADHRRAVPIGSDRGSDQGRPPIVNGMTTRDAAKALGISDRAVRKRLNGGTLRGEQQTDGTWLIDPDDVA